jgi:nitrogen-specific signal transduction histidine kinase
MVKSRPLFIDSVEFLTKLINTLEILLASKSNSGTLPDKSNSILIFFCEVAMRMAHEIKNPLTPILLSAQRIRNKFLEKLKGKDSEIMDKTTGVIIDRTSDSCDFTYATLPSVN